MVKILISIFLISQTLLFSNDNLCGENEKSTKNNKLCYKNECLESLNNSLEESNNKCSSEFGRGWRIPFYSETTATKKLFAKNMDLNNNSFDNTYEFMKTLKKEGVPPCDNKINNFSTLTLSKGNDNRHILFKKNGKDTKTILSNFTKGSIRCVKEN